MESEINVYRKPFILHGGYNHVLYFCHDHLGRQCLPEKKRLEIISYCLYCMFISQRRKYRAAVGNSFQCHTNIRLNK